MLKQYSKRPDRPWTLTFRDQQIGQFADASLAIMAVINHQTGAIAWDDYKGPEKPPGHQDDWV